MPVEKWGLQFGFAREHFSKSALTWTWKSNELHATQRDIPTLQVGNSGMYIFWMFPFILYFYTWCTTGMCYGFKAVQWLALLADVPYLVSLSVYSFLNQYLNVLKLKYVQQRWLRSPEVSGGRLHPPYHFIFSSRMVQSGGTWQDIEGLVDEVDASHAGESWFFWPPAFPLGLLCGALWRVLGLSRITLSSGITRVVQSTPGDKPKGGDAHCGT